MLKNKLRESHWLKCLLEEGSKLLGCQENNPEQAHWQKWEDIQVPAQSISTQVLSRTEEEDGSRVVLTRVSDTPLRSTLTRMSGWTAEWKCSEFGGPKRGEVLLGQALIACLHYYAINCCRGLLEKRECASSIPGQPRRLEELMALAPGGDLLGWLCGSAASPAGNTRLPRVMCFPPAMWFS